MHFSKSATTNVLQPLCMTTFGYFLKSFGIVLGPVLVAEMQKLKSYKSVIQPTTTGRFLSIVKLTRTRE